MQGINADEDEGEHEIVDETTDVVFGGDLLIEGDFFETGLLLHSTINDANRKSITNDDKLN